MSPTRLRIKALRTAAGLTQAQLAERLGVRRATVADLENGASRGETLELIDRLCKALSCEPAGLFERTAKRGRGKRSGRRPSPGE